MPEQKEQFKIIYDGSALKNHEMDVKDLAPALLAVGDLLEETNRVLNQNLTSVQVNVKGNFKTGCFQIDFSLAQDVGQQINAFFNSGTAMTTLGILQILGFCGIDIPSVKNSLILFIKKLKNRTIKKITKSDNDGIVVIEVENEKFKIDEKIIELFKNIKIRKSLELIINKPLQKNGIDLFRVEHKKHSTQVNKDEMEYFKLPDTGDEPLDEHEVETNLQAISVSFLEDNKWRFTDGNVTFHAVVSDKEFLTRVQENKESFAKDDILKVRLKTKQFVGDAGIRTEYEIIKVISHRSSAKQILLPFTTS